jgi:hypothetical protein
MGFPPDNKEHSPAARRLNELGAVVTHALRELLEHKHLYQSVPVQIGNLGDRPLDGPIGRIDENARAAVAATISQPWHLVDNLERRPTFLSGLRLDADVPHVKLFCVRCNRTEAFNSISATDMLARDYMTPVHALGDKVIQVFVLSFLCQSCKTVPEVFLVRREGLRLSLEGRSPIEHVEVPNVLPKNLEKFYTGAIIAKQCGHTLSGLFMLRTLIEQWVRSLGWEEPRASDAIDSYVASLPEDFRNRFPCLRDEYKALSDDIHSATGSPEVFDRVHSAILRHFDARRVFGMIKQDFS